jgi:peptide deformylase
MSILKIARIGHPVIRTAAEPVPPKAFGDPAFQKLIDDMQETMYEYEGVGVAAPQVHVGLRLAVLEVPGSESQEEVPFTVLANPMITPVGDEAENGWEGCLSVPDLRGVVPRIKHIRLEALDRHGKPFSVEASDFFARVIQHECDHLDGGVYLDRMTDMKSLTFIKEFETHVLGDGDES